MSRPLISRPTHVYVGAVATVCLGLLTVAAVTGPAPDPTRSLALLAVALLVSWFGDSDVQTHLGISLLGILLLASAALLGPLGAGLLGVLVASVSRGQVPWSARVFNSSLSGILGVAAGLTYAVAGGSSSIGDLRGLGPVGLQVALPLLAADVVQALLNVVLIIGIMWVSQGVPVRLTAARLLVSSGAVALVYGVLAVLLVVLWLPADLGAFSLVLLIAPLFGAQWVLGLYAEQLRAEEQSLDLLVAAIELRRPDRVGHATRVGDLAGRMAEHLGLGVAEVADIRRAGVLHDLGQIGLPAGRLDSRQAPTQVTTLEHPQRGARMLKGISFLEGAANLLNAAEGARGDAGTPLGVEIVTVAAAFDVAQILKPGTSVEEFLANWPATADLSTRVIDALRWGVQRASG